MRKSSHPWIRSYRDALHNPKILSLSDRLFRMWQCCLWIADDDGALPKMRDISLHLRVTATEAEQIICDLIEVELVDVSSPETPQRTLTMHDWKAHQYIDHSTERVRKFRNKNKAKKAKTTEQDETRFTPLQKHSYSYSETEEESLVLPSLPVAARKQEPSFDSDFGNGKKDALTRRAEGLGLDVDDLIATVNERQPKKRAAYFTRLCLTQLMPRLPGLPEDFIRDALWGKNPKGYEAIMQTLNLAEAP